MAKKKDYGKLKDTTKKVIGWTAIIYFIYAIYTYTRVFLGGSIQYTSYYLGWVIMFIAIIGFDLLAITTIYIWKKPTKSYKESHE